MLLYEIGKESSMQEASEILLKIEELRGLENPLHVVLVGTKFDLFKGDDVEEIFVSCNKQFNIFPNWEENHKLTSAKNNSNITGVFDLVLDYIITSIPINSLPKEKSENDSEKRKSCATQWIVSNNDNLKNIHPKQ